MEIAYCVQFHSERSSRKTALYMPARSCPSHWHYSAPSLYLNKVVLWTVMKVKYQLQSACKSTYPIPTRSVPRIFIPSDRASNKTILICNDQALDGRSSNLLVSSIVRYEALLIEISGFRIENSKSRSNCVRRLSIVLASNISVEYSIVPLMVSVQSYTKKVRSRRAVFASTAVIRHAKLTP